MNEVLAASVSVGPWNPALTDYAGDWWLSARRFHDLLRVIHGMSRGPKRVVSRPATLSEYVEWAKTTLQAYFMEDQSRSLYDVNLQTAFNTVSQHPFFLHLGARLQAWSSEYKAATQSQLLMSGDAPLLLIKPYASALNKSFRANVLWNRGFPKPPAKGWVTPANLFSYFNDAIRTTLVCKFIDGQG